MLCNEIDSTNKINNKRIFLLKVKLKIELVLYYKVHYIIYSLVEIYLMWIPFYHGTQREFCNSLTVIPPYHYLPVYASMLEF